MVTYEELIQFMQFVMEGADDQGNLSFAEVIEQQAIPIDEDTTIALFSHLELTIRGGVERGFDPLMSMTFGLYLAFVVGHYIGANHGRLEQ